MFICFFSIKLYFKDTFMCFDNFYGKIFHQYCRPIRIKFVKETIDIIINEIDYTYNANCKLNSRNNSLWERNFIT